MRKNLIALLALTVVVAVGFYVGMNGVAKTDSAPATESTSNSVSASAEVAAAPVVAVEPSAGDDSVLYKGALMGSPDAPVKIKEFASLSCSHCADFHTQILPSVKKELIETGMVQFEFVHFPLNASAMDATLISQCMPEERQQQFVAFLFEQQEKWAFDQNYRQILKQNAKLLGMSDEKLDACLADETAKQAIVARIQEVQAKYNIQSTPSFVINETETFSGVLPFSEFKKKVDAHMPQQEKASE